MTNYIPTSLETVNKFAESKKDDFLDILRNSTSESRTTPEDKIIFMWSIVSVKTKEIKDIEENRMEFLSLTFDERFEHELKKTRLSLLMRAGNFMVQDRVNTEEFPNEVKDLIFAKLITVMNAEQSIIRNDKVLSTIPKPKVVKKGEIEDETVVEKPTKKSTKKLDIDTILDKLNEKGIDSLSEEEKNYLQNNS